MCTERKATGLFVLTSFLCDNGALVLSLHVHVPNVMEPRTKRKIAVLFDATFRKGETCPVA